jgi:hypothetical protein
LRALACDAAQPFLPPDALNAVLACLLVPFLPRSLPHARRRLSQRYAQ